MSTRTLLPIAVIVACTAVSGWLVFRSPKSSNKVSPSVAAAPAASTPQASEEPQPSPSRGLPIRNWRLGESHLYDIDTARAVAMTQVSPQPNASQTPLANRRREPPESSAMNPRFLDRLAIFSVIGSLALALGLRDAHSLMGHAVGQAAELPAEAHATLPPTPGVKPVQQSRLRGRLSLTPVEIDGNGVRVRAELRAPNLEMAPSPEASTLAQLSRPFYFVASQGDVGSFAFEKGVSVDARGQLRALITSLNVATPAGSLSSWQTSEHDLTGDYEAHYSVAERTVTKVKARYTAAHGPKGSTPFPKDSKVTVRSKARFDIGDSGWPTQSFEEENLDVSMRGIRVLSASQTLAHSQGTEMHPELIGEKGTDLEGEAATDAQAFAAAKVDAKRNRIKGRNFSTILADYKGGDSQSKSRDSSAMRSIFQLQPETAFAARDALIGDEIDHFDKKRITSALGAAGTPESQQALLSVAHNKSIEKDTRESAIAALALAKHPTQETVNDLAKTTHDEDHDIAHHAALALGGEVKTLNADHSLETKDAVQLLVDRLSSAQSDDERIAALQALGNTADPRALSSILAYTTSPSGPLRAAAVAALRFQSDKSADAAILAAANDPEEFVRKAAAKTLPYREIADLLPAMENLLKKDPSVVVRIAVISGLKKHMSEYPSILTAFQWSLENDSSNKVKEAIQSILETN